MTRYLLRRLLLLIPTLLGITVLVFLLLQLIPGDPALVMLGTDASPADLARFRRIMGLDQPPYVQFARYLGRVVRGDLGDSLFHGLPVLRLVASRAPATIELAVLSLLLTTAVSVPLGVLAAVRQGSWLDLLATFFAQLGIAVPIFWSGILLLLFFSVELRWFPTFGEGVNIATALDAALGGDWRPLARNLRHAVLPTVSLALFSSALTTRMVRSAMLDVLHQDYLRTARSKGLVERLVLSRHAAPNALLPVITIIGLQLGALLGGAVITETIFAWPGLGRLTVEAINQRDFPVVQGTVLVLALAVSLINLLVDLSYAWIDPRIRYE